MPNNLSILEYKLFETDFFLGKIRECKNSIETHSHADYYFSAFLSSSRSITFVMQSSFSKIPEFDKWYDQARDSLKGSDLARFFVDARNYSQKRGTSHVNTFRISGDETSFYFSSNGEHSLLIKTETIEASEKYFKHLLEIVKDFFVQFGEYVNPKLYYTIEKLKERGQTIKELEYEIWGYNNKFWFT